MDRINADCAASAYLIWINGLLNAMNMLRALHAKNEMIVAGVSVSWIHDGT